MALPFFIALATSLALFGARMVPRAVKSGVLRRCVPIDAECLGDGIRRLACRDSLSDLLPQFRAMLGLPMRLPCALARAMPARVRSDIFCASTLASEASRARRILRTSSLSVARCASV